MSLPSNGISENAIAGRLASESFEKLVPTKFLSVLGRLPA